jgi:hypothetical protein
MEKNINRTSEKRKKKDEENPGKFIGGFFMFVQNIEADHYTEPLKEIIQITKELVRFRYKKKDKCQLDKY